MMRLPSWSALLLGLALFSGEIEAKPNLLLPTAPLWSSSPTWSSVSARQYDELVPSAEPE